MPKALRFSLLVTLSVPVSVVPGLGLNGVFGLGVFLMSGMVIRWATLCRTPLWPLLIKVLTDV